MTFKKTNRQQVDKMIADGAIHLDFMAKIYDNTFRQGRHFVHEHPATAGSWNGKCMVDLMARRLLYLTTADQCKYGQQTNAGDPLKKPAGSTSNAPGLREALRGGASAKAACALGTKAACTRSVSERGRSERPYPRTNYAWPS